MEMQKQRLRNPATSVPLGDEIRPLAKELNEIIERENPHVYTMLSELGKRTSSPKAFPRQSAEAIAKAKRHDATIGIAREKGKPMFLPSIMKYFNDLTPGEALTYVPGTGRPDLRKKWREEMIRKNPSLADKSFSLPIVTGGVTHALSLVGDMFLDRGDMVLLPDKFWENYDLLYSVRMQAQLGLYPIFNAAGGFNVAALRQALARPVVGKRWSSSTSPTILRAIRSPRPEADRLRRIKGGGRRRPQSGRGDRRRLFRPILWRRPGPGVALCAAGEPARADPGGEG